ncbi:MAG: hypothetical protein ACLP8S_03645, partial [Solirubrobacteraceae bacterium]
MQSQISLEYDESKTNQQSGDPDPGRSSIAQIFHDGGVRVFVAGRDLDLVAADGQECAISEGDAQVLSTAPPLGSGAAV